MPFIEAAVASAKEDELVPEGMYDLVIESADMQESKRSGAEQIMVTIKFVDAPIDNPAPIFHYITMPLPDDDARKRNFKNVMARRFLSVFGIPFEENGFNTDDFPGATGRCLVAQSEILRDDKPTNEYTHQLRLPKFANEPAGVVDENGNPISNGESRRERNRRR